MSTLTWRIKPTFANLSPFGTGETGRPLRIIIDNETVCTDPAVDLLQAFSARPKVELFRTDPAAPARVQLGPENATQDFLKVKYVHPTGSREVALGAANSLQSLAQTIAVEHDFDVQETWHALALMNMGRLHEIDAVVCAAPVYARNELSDMSRKGHIVTAKQACALLGLFLRAHKDFTVHVEGNHATFLPYEEVLPRRSDRCAPPLRAISSLCLGNLARGPKKEAICIAARHRDPAGPRPDRTGLRKCTNPALAPRRNLG
jgi:hypothetical protein